MGGKRLVATADCLKQQQHSPDVKLTRNNQLMGNVLAMASVIDYDFDEEKYDFKNFSGLRLYQQNAGSGYGQVKKNIFSRRRPRVRFAMTIKKQEVLSLTEYTKSEIKNCWYTAEEKKSRVTKREKTIIRMESGKPARSSTPYRGLEDWTEKGIAKLTERITSCLDAVMDEQELQWQAEKDDYDRIAEVCQKVTLISAQEAFQRAVQDRKDALKALRDCEASVASESSRSLSVADEDDDDGVDIDRRALFRRTKSRSFSRGEDKWTKGKWTNKERIKQSVLATKSKSRVSRKDPPGAVLTSTQQAALKQKVVSKAA